MIDRNIFLEHKKNKQWYYLGNVVSDIEFTLVDLIRLIRSHPNDKQVNFNHENQSIELQQIQSRGSLPFFAKSILNQLREIYKQKNITLIAFSGYGADSKSFKIHKDKMDVIYLQVYGEIIWSVWESDKTTPNIQPEQGTCVFKQKFVPGDMIYIPAGTFHHVEHLDKPRIGFSFGNA
jgi:ribosomal protein L16 Arg81 hydroxylase